MLYKLWITQSFKESAFTFRYPKVNPEGTRRWTIHRRQVEVVIILLATQVIGLNLPTEVACLLILLHLHLPLHQGEHCTQTVPTASEMPTVSLITMRDTEPVLTAQGATMTGGLVPSRLPLRHLPLRWLENVSHSTRTIAARSRLLLRPTW